MFLLYPLFSINKSKKAKRCLKRGFFFKNRFRKDLNVGSKVITCRLAEFFTIEKKTEFYYILNKTFRNEKYG